MIELSYGPAALEDVPVIFEQCKLIIDQYEDKSLIQYKKVIAWLRKKIEDNISQYTCVKLGNQKVAFYRMDPADDLTELDDFYVLPNFRCKGIGSSILKKCIDESNNSLYLYVFSGNVRAVSFYRRHGFMEWEKVSPTRFKMIHHT